ncbi:MAG: helix-turn-helix domain-containing protein [Bacteroidota bacterium]|jgi:excisionase family DNA binding protein
METIQIISESFRRVLEKLDQVDRKLEKNTGNPLSDTWLDIDETCDLLKISRRTLQNYRDNGILPFSQVGGKIYFRASDIEDHLHRHYVKAFNDKH